MNYKQPNNNKENTTIIDKLKSISFINGLITIFYTFSKEGDGLGVIAALLIGPLLIMPQLGLAITTFMKKENFIFDLILIIGGLISTILILGIVNYSINIFILLNVALLIIMLLVLLNNHKEIKRQTKTNLKV